MAQDRDTRTIETPKVLRGNGEGVFPLFSRLGSLESVFSPLPPPSEVWRGAISEITFGLFYL